jgi:hypothetical protein
MGAPCPPPSFPYAASGESGGTQAAPAEGTYHTLGQQLLEQVIAIIERVRPLLDAVRRKDRELAWSADGNAKTPLTARSQSHSALGLAGRGGQIRTADLTDPNRARFQTALRPESGRGVTLTGGGENDPCEPFCQALSREAAALYAPRKSGPFPRTAEGWDDTQQPPDTPMPGWVRAGTEGQSSSHASWGRALR